MAAMVLIAAASSPAVSCRSAVVGSIMPALEGAAISFPSPAKHVHDELHARRLVSELKWNRKATASSSCPYAVGRECRCTASPSPTLWQA